MAWHGMDTGQSHGHVTATTRTGVCAVQPCSLQAAIHATGLVPPSRTRTQTQAQQSGWAMQRGDCCRGAWLSAGRHSIHDPGICLHFRTQVNLFTTEIITCCSDGLHCA